MSSHSTTLMFHHEWGMHDTIPHPSCPICERLRVQGRAVVDVVGIDAAFETLADTVEEATDVPTFNSKAYEAAHDRCDAAILRAIEAAKTAAKALQKAKGLKKPDAIQRAIEAALESIGESVEEMDTAGGARMSAHGDASELCDWAHDTNNAVEPMLEAVTGMEQQLPFSDTVKRRNNGNSPMPERFPW